MFRKLAVPAAALALTFLLLSLRLAPAQKGKPSSRPPHGQDKMPGPALTPHGVQFLVGKPHGLLFGKGIDASLTLLAVYPLEQAQEKVFGATSRLLGRVNVDLS